ncbi:MAG: TonB-dependent receptor [Bacteroidota bacterium]
MKQLLLPFLMCYGIFSLSAQTQKDSTVYLEDVIISENRLKTPFLESPRAATVLTAKELRQTPGQSLATVLQNVPGLDVRERGPNGVQADLSLRGGTFDQTLVLLNGIKLSDPQTGHHALAIPLNLDNLEQVEVLKGPAARVYGQNAFTGAINLVTRIPDQKRFDLNVYGGDFGTAGVTAGMAIPVSENWKNYVSVSQDQSNGYRHNTDFRTTNVFYDSQLETQNGYFRLQTGYTDRQFGANGFYSSPGRFPNMYEELQTSLMSLAYTHEGENLTFTPRIYWRRNEDVFVLIRDNPDFFKNEHVSNVLGTELNGLWTNALGETGIGIEYRNENINSTNLGDRSRDNFGLYLEHRFRIGDRLTVTPGMNLNYYSDFDFNVFPSLEAGFKAWENGFLFAQAGTSYRIPTYTDLYYEDPNNLGNANLQPEEAFIYEIGARHSGKGWFAEVSFFDQFTQQLIDWTRQSQDEPWQVRNFTDVRMTGIETQLTLMPEALLGKQILWVEQFSLGYNYLNGEIEAQEEFNFSRYALQNLTHQFIGKAEQKFRSEFSHSLRVRWSERVSGESFWVIDSRITWDKTTYAFFAEASNLTNSQYLGVNEIPMPGRWFRAGLNLKVGF